VGPPPPLGGPKRGFFSHKGFSSPTPFKIEGCENAVKSPPNFPQISPKEVFLKVPPKTPLITGFFGHCLSPPPLKVKALKPVLVFGGRL